MAVVLMVKQNVKMLVKICNLVISTFLLCMVNYHTLTFPEFPAWHFLCHNLC